MDFDISFLWVIFLLYVAKILLIDTKIRKQVSRVYTKNEYIKKVMFKPYILYIKDKRYMEPNLFWLNMGVVIWLLLSTVLGLIHLYLIEMWIAKYMFSCNAFLLVVVILYCIFWLIRSSLSGDVGFPHHKKAYRRNAYIYIIMVVIAIVFMISIWVTNHFGN